MNENEAINLLNLWRSVSLTDDACEFADHVGIDYDHAAVSFYLGYKAAINSLAVEPTKPKISKTCWTCRKNKGDKDCADHDQQYMGGCPIWASIAPEIVEPSDDADEIAWNIEGLFHKREHYTDDHEKIKSIITARDERIRRECADRAREAIVSKRCSVIHKSMAANYAERAILGTEPAREESE